MISARLDGVGRADAPAIFKEAVAATAETSVGDERGPLPTGRIPHIFCGTDLSGVGTVLEVNVEENSRIELIEVTAR